MNQIPFDPYDFFGYLSAGAVVILGMQLTLGFPSVLGRNLNALEIAILILATYIAGQLTATPAKALLEDCVIDKLLGRPNITLFRERAPHLRACLFPGYYKPLPVAIRNKIMTKAKGEGCEAEGESFFLHVRFRSETREDEKLMLRLQSFLNKYGFARNLSFTSFILGLALLIKARTVADPELTQYAITSLVVAILLFYRYLKFFRQYSYEMFNAYGGNQRAN